MDSQTSASEDKAPVDSTETKKKSKLLYSNFINIQVITSLNSQQRYVPNFYFQLNFSFLCFCTYITIH